MTPDETAAAQDPRAVPRADYAETAARWSEQAESLARSAERYSNARLLVFGVGVVALFAGRTGAATLAGLLFAVLVVVHLRAQVRLQRARRAAAFHERGLARVTDAWSGEGPTGDGHREHDHPFADDLDLFGRGSLFQRLATGRTPLGEETLARWMLSPVDAATASRRQGAARALSGDGALREGLALLGDERLTRFDPAALRAWVARAPRPLPGWARPVALALGLGGVASGAAFVVGAGAVPLLLVALADAAFFRLVGPRLSALSEGVETAAADLSLLAALLALFEGRAFGDPELDGLVARLRSGGDRPPSALVDRFDRLVQRHVNATSNAVYAFFAFFLLTRVHLAPRLQAWRVRLAPLLEGWLAAAGALEAHVVVGTYVFENPDDAMPALHEAPATFDARGLGHPLLPRARLVRNDVRLDERTRLLLVSGSNMSGKSTLLRAVGCNLVLARLGAPVRARAMTSAPFRLGASIRIVDSLQEGESKFFAEIRRLRQIDLATQRQGPYLFLLDEILHGTNSSDRLAGGAAVLTAFLDRGACGLVSTHDLALARMVEDLGGRARNAHFADRLVGGRVVFDYRLRDGVVERGNALALMRSLGLEV